MPNRELRDMTLADLQSLWTEVRKASRRRHVASSLDKVRITCGDVTVTARLRNRIMPSLREVLAVDRDRALHDQPNQGKVMACVAAHRASYHFVRPGAYRHFAHWQCVYRARLNLLPLNGARMWGPPDRDQRLNLLPLNGARMWGPPDRDLHGPQCFLHCSSHHHRSPGPCGGTINVHGCL
ncbi:hypothetical protein MTO96_029575 [Rhipicephalus appendiculatus]